MDQHARLRPTDLVQLTVRCRLPSILNQVVVIDLLLRQLTPLRPINLYRPLLLLYRTLNLLHNFCTRTNQNLTLVLLRLVLKLVIAILRCYLVIHYVRCRTPYWVFLLELLDWRLFLAYYKCVNTTPLLRRVVRLLLLNNRPRFKITRCEIAIIDLFINRRLLRLLILRWYCISNLDGRAV